MDGLRRSKRVKVLSNVVLSSQKDTPSDGKSARSDSAGKKNQGSPSTSSKAELCKNLFFELPTAQSSAQKRKLSASSAGNGNKRAKPAEDVSAKFEEETVFNYLTGKYETVRKAVGLISEEVIIKSDEEEMLEVSPPAELVISPKTSQHCSNISKETKSVKPSEKQFSAPVCKPLPKLIPKSDQTPKSGPNNNDNNVLYFVLNTNNMITSNNVNSVHLQSNVTNLLPSNASNTHNLLSNNSNFISANLLSNPNNVVTSVPNTLNLMTLNGSSAVNLMPNTNNVVIPNSLTPNTMNLMCPTGSGSVNLLPSVMTTGNGTVNLLSNACSTNNLVTSSGSNTINLLSTATNANQLMTSVSNNTVNLLSNATILNNASMANGCNTITLLSNATNTNRSITSNGSNTVNLSSVTHQSSSTSNGSKTVSSSSKSTKSSTPKTTILKNGSMLMNFLIRAPGPTTRKATNSVNVAANTADVVDITEDEPENTPEQSEQAKSKTLTQKLEELKHKMVTWKCKTCGFKATTKQDLIAHLYEKHLKKDYEIKVKCKQCSFECVDRVEMQRHESTHGMDASNTNASTSAAAKEKPNTTEARIIATVDLTSEVDDTTPIASPQSQAIVEPVKEIQQTSSVNVKFIAKCYDCDMYMQSNHARLFEKHVYRHYGSKFKCLDHVGNRRERCLKCHYERVLGIIKKELKVCENCGYQTFRKRYMTAHRQRRLNSCQGTIYLNNIKLHPGEISCFGCKYITSHKNLLYYHMVEHLDQKYECYELHPTVHHDCPKCANVNALQQAKKDVQTCQKCDYKSVIPLVFEKHQCIPKVTDKSPEKTKQNDKPREATDLEVRCFDCKFSCSKKGPDFEKHVLLHVGSKFQCIGPHKSNVEDCSKCYYEGLLSKISKVAKTCRTCAYKTLDEASLKAHSEAGGACLMWLNRTLEARELRCLMCKYLTTHKKFLKYHMVDHLEETVTCDVHGGTVDFSCETCYNGVSLEAAKKEIIICKKCNFKTVIKQVFNAHKCLDEIPAKSVDSNEKIDKSANKNNDETESRTTHPKNKENIEKSLEEIEAQTINAIILNISGDKGGNTESSNYLERFGDKDQGDQNKVLVDSFSHDDNEKGVEDHEAQAMHSANPRSSDDKSENMETEVSKSQYSNDLASADGGPNKIDVECPDNGNNEKSVENIEVQTTPSENPIISGDQDCNMENMEVSEPRHSNSLENAGGKVGGPNEIRGAECSNKANNEKGSENIEAQTTPLVNPTNQKESLHSNNLENAGDKDGVQNTIGDVECSNNANNKKGLGNIEAQTTPLVNPTNQKESLHSNNLENAGDKDGVQNTIGDVECSNNANNKKGLGNMEAQTAPSVTPITSGDDDCNMENQEVSESLHSSSGDKDSVQNKVKDVERNDINEKTLNPIVSATQASTMENSEVSESPDSTNSECPAEDGKQNKAPDVECPISDNNKKSVGDNGAQTMSPIDTTISGDKGHNIESSEVSESRHSGNQDSSAHKEGIARKSEGVECSSNDNNESGVANIDAQSAQSINPIMPGDQDKNIDNSEVSESGNSVDKEGGQNNVENMKCGQKESVAEIEAHPDNPGCSRDKDNSIRNKKGNIKSGVAKRSKIMAKCYDCKFSSPEIDISFIKHVCLHIGSKYQCVKHWNKKLNDCIQCNYEVTLQTLEKAAVKCQICGFKAVCEASLKAHLQEFGSCSKWAHRKLQIGEISCLDCQYATTHKKYLKYHMVDHLQMDFSCDLHPRKKNMRCEKCINEKCLRDAKKEVNICEKCNFTTVIEQIFQLHESECNPRKEIHEQKENTAGGEIEDQMDFPIPYVFLEKIEL